MAFTSKRVESFNTVAGLESALITETLDIFKDIWGDSSPEMIYDIKTGLQISMLQQLGTTLMNSIGNTGKVHASDLPTSWEYTKEKIAGYNIPKWGGAVETLIFAPDMKNVDNKQDADYAYADLASRVGNMGDIKIRQKVDKKIRHVSSAMLSDSLKSIDKTFDVTFTSSVLNRSVTLTSKRSGVELKALTQDKGVSGGSKTSEDGFDKLSRDAEQIFNEDILGKEGSNFTDKSREMQRYILFLSIFKLYEKMNTLLLIELERPWKRIGDKRDYIKFKAMSLFHQLIFEKIAPAIRHGLVKIDVTVKNYDKDRKNKYSLGINISYNYDGLDGYLKELGKDASLLTNKMNNEKLKAAGIYKYDLTVYSEKTGVADSTFFKPAVFMLNKMTGKYVYAEYARSLGLTQVSRKPRRNWRRTKKRK